MPIKGTQRKNDYAKKVGFDELSVIAFNPNKEELVELLNIPEIKDPVYTGTWQDPATAKPYPKTSVSVWFEGKTSKALLNTRFVLINKPAQNKDGSKVQFINTAGDTAWAADENTLKMLATEAGNPKESSRKFYKTFISREYRPALMGEQKLYDFLQKFTNIDTRDLGMEITLDTKQLFKGNFEELQDLLSSEYKDNTLCGCATIRSQKKLATPEDPNPEGFNEFQGLYDEFLPGGYIRYFHEGVKTRPDYVNKYIANLEGEYGTKDFYIVGPIQDYDPKMNTNTAKTSTTGSQKAVPDHVPDPAGVDDLPF